MGATGPQGGGFQPAPLERTRSDCDFRTNEHHYNICSICAIPDHVPNKIGCTLVFRSPRIPRAMQTGEGSRSVEDQGTSRVD